jgi:hypothetical protein
MEVSWQALFPMALSTKQAKTFRQHCNQIRKSWGCGKPTDLHSSQFRGLHFIQADVPPATIDLDPEDPALAPGGADFQNQALAI